MHIVVSGRQHVVWTIKQTDQDLIRASASTEERVIKNEKLSQIMNLSGHRQSNIVAQWCLVAMHV